MLGVGLQSQGNYPVSQGNCPLTPPQRGLSQVRC